jgi:2'-5' RNA ligase
MRMFVAVVPPPDVLDDLAAFVEPRQDVDSPLRWAAPESWHLTLAFMESVSEHNLDELTERLTRAAHRRHPFDLQLAGAGTFPNPARAKVLWAGVQGDTEHLGQLAVGARAAAAKSGIDVDGAKYRPHLTLARLNRPVDVTKWLRVFDLYAGPSWRVTEIELIESHLGQGPRGRPRYQTVDTFALDE